MILSTPIVCIVLVIINISYFMFYFCVICNGIKIFVRCYYDSWRWLSSRNKSDGKYKLYEICAVMFVISHSVCSWIYDDIFDAANSQELQDFFSFRNFTSITWLKNYLLSLEGIIFVFFFDLTSTLNCTGRLRYEDVSRGRPC